MEPQSAGDNAERCLRSEARGSAVNIPDRLMGLIFLGTRCFVQTPSPLLVLSSPDAGSGVPPSRML